MIENEIAQINDSVLKLGMEHIKTQLWLQLPNMVIFNIIITFDNCLIPTQNLAGVYVNQVEVILFLMNHMEW
jgi:hypothetical protein